MPEYVSRAVRENIFSLPHYRVRKSYDDSLLPNGLLGLPLHEARKPCVDTFQVESPFGYPHYNPLYRYELLAEIFRPGEHYFPEGVVAHTDAKFDIFIRDRVPYGGEEATKRHEIKHIEREKESKPHDEAQINREVTAEMGLHRFPFPSYS